MTVNDQHTPAWREDESSQIPALLLLVAMGWTYLSPDEALAARGGRTGRVLLGDVLAEWLRTRNAIRYRDEAHVFSESNIQAAIQALEDVPPESLIRTNERAYDLLRLGKSLPQLIRGDLRSFPLQYVDWEQLDRNVYHVTEEFAVDASGVHDTARPDIVLFVNGIPFAVIECKQAGEKKPAAQAIEQQIRNQKPEYIPRLFAYTQLLLALSPNEARYGTVGTAEKFWSVWKEAIHEGLLTDLANRPVPSDVSEKLFARRWRHVREHMEALATEKRLPSEQDRTLFALCRPARLMEMSRRFVVFDAGEKKVARYQQFFCVRNTLQRVAAIGSDGSRRGGVVWHTQGSGKSLTMVMLATAVAEEYRTAPGRKVVLVTDRIDLDDQLWKTFHHCGLEPQRARTGKHLAELLQDPDVPVITTVIGKFEAATKLRITLQSPNMFVLVDEGHRGQYLTLHANMRRVMPHACFLGFTGTPVAKKDRNTVEKFGGLIEPVYTITEAVADKAVVPLLYEGRDVPQMVDTAQIDRWFERITATLTDDQAADLKRKFSSTSQLNKAEQKVAAIAWDVSAHFARTWQGTGFKGQFVAPDKATAIRYKKYFDEIGMVSTEVLISAPDDREGDSDVYAENDNAVVTFWRGMVGKAGRFADEEEYNKQLINAFKFGDTPEILIVVSKLLTGFDAPRNVVLYLTRKFGDDHTLLQAIARVNRVYAGKDFGYVIDYAGVLHRLSEALDLYGSLAGFEPDEIDGTIVDVWEEVKKLPQRYSELRDVFKSVPNKRDQEAYERLLADEAIRDDFYRCLGAYARTLSVALGTVRFLEETPEEKVRKYKDDLRFFEALRRSVRRRYAETIDFGEYEPKIQRLLDRHVGTGEVEIITPLVDIFDRDAFAREVDAATTPASKADLIASRTARTIRERMDDDPAFYRRFSELLQQAIADWRAQRMSDVEYLGLTTHIRDAVTNREQEALPPSVQYDPMKRAVFGLVRETASRYSADSETVAKISEAAALSIDAAIDERRVVNWTESTDVQNRMRTAVEDLLFDLKARYGLDMALDDIDNVMEQSIRLAVRHEAR